MSEEDTFIQQQDGPQVDEMIEMIDWLIEKNRARCRMVNPVKARR